MNSERETWLDREERKAREAHQATIDLMERVGAGEQICCEQCGTLLRVWPVGGNPYCGLSCENRCTYAHLNFGSRL